MEDLQLALIGPAGEPVDLRRVLHSHGCATLPPMSPDNDGTRLSTVVSLPRGRPRAVLVEADGPARARVSILGPRPSAGVQLAVVDALRHILRLDEDLSGFYERVRADPQLAWVATGAGRMLRSQSAFQDVVATICTTNCAWSATERMVGALVRELGEPALGDPTARAFPSPAAVAAAGEPFFRDVARAGYRGRYLVQLAEDVAEGRLDLEALRDSEVPDDEVERRLLALPGVGPYAAAHVMLLLGRYSRLILDSWTRPTYARLVGRAASDTTIRRRFARYGPWRGLAFWLFLTRGWVAEPEPPPTS